MEPEAEDVGKMEFESGATPSFVDYMVKLKKQQGEMIKPVVLDFVQCSKNPQCVRENRHRGWCKVPKVPKVGGFVRCSKNSQCVREDRHPGRCKALKVLIPGNCERCEKLHDGSYGSGRFCSESCAYGEKRSEEHKAKISASLKGKKLLEETKAKISASLKGHKHLEETKAKMKGSKKLSEEHKAIISAVHKGKKRSEETKAKMSTARNVYHTENRMKLCFNIRDFDKDPLIEGEIRCQHSDNVLQLQCERTNLSHPWGKRKLCGIHYVLKRRTGAISADGTTAIYDKLDVDDFDNNYYCVLCGATCDGECVCAMCGEWCCGMCMGKEYSSDYTGDGPKKAVALMFCAVDGCKEPRMPRIGFCSKHNALSKSLMRMEGMTSPLQVKNKMSEMLRKNQVIKQGKIIYQNGGPGIGDQCRFCEDTCVNATYGVCGKHRFFLRLIDKLESPVHQKFCHKIEERVEELKECQVEDCLKISAHLDLCKHHFFRYSEIRVIDDRAPTVAHNKRIEMVNTATETSYVGMSADVQEYMQGQDNIVSEVDLVTMREELQSVQAELQVWIEMKAEAEASGGDAGYETTEVETLRAKVVEIQAMISDAEEPAAEDVPRAELIREQTVAERSRRIEAEVTAQMEEAAAQQSEQGLVTVLSDQIEEINSQLSALSSDSMI
eukprot:SAG11_NODE_711_length_7641_cov_103.798064_4_plen_667_part_00